jgi:hypothetical protein
MEISVFFLSFRSAFCDWLLANVHQLPSLKRLCLETLVLNRDVVACDLLGELPV